VQPAHHKVRAVRVAPKIVQGHNMQVFQPGDELSFCLKSTDKFWLVGVLRQNDFDRNFTFDNCLIRPINRAKAPRS
jgi:hypothetical protein